MLIAGPNPSTGSSGNVLAIVAGASFADLEAELTRVGYRATAVENPYDAFLELLERPLVYRAVVISLPALYREELAFIKSVRARLPHIDVLIAHTDGRHAALAEAMRLGATALLSDEAVHRLADIEPTPDSAEPDVRAADDASHEELHDEQPARESARRTQDDDEASDEIEPLLTADELRALLQEHPPA